MSFPFISRSTYDAVVAEKNERIMELKARVAKMEEELKIARETLTDVMSCRAIGYSIHGRILPPSDTSVEEDDEPTQSKLDPATDSMPTQLESDMSELGNKARALMRRANSRSQAEINELDRAFALAREAGEARAVAGNGQGEGY